MTGTLAFADFDTERAGVIGDRQLVAVQTFFVSRLTSHPIVIVPGTFVAVTGRGPRGDSNGSGKTSFLAAVSLLLGDREWRLAGGAKAPTALLFNASVVGGAAESISSASHGFVVGLFTRPDQPAASARTVWLRIDTTPPYVTARWVDGNALVVAFSDREAHGEAGIAWQSLPRNEHGFDTYARVLYGDAPRCLAYVQQRGEGPNKPSLLQMNAGAFSPADIGESLIRLTGQRHLLDTELEQRKVLADHVRRLDDLRTEHERVIRVEDIQLEGVGQRDRARGELEQAGDAWRRHFAAGLLETLERRADLDAELHAARRYRDETQATLSDAARRHDQLRGRTDLDERVEQAETAALRADESLREAMVELQRRTDERVTLTDELTAVRLTASGGLGLDPQTAATRIAAVQRERDDALGAATIAKATETAAEERLHAVDAGGAGLAGVALSKLREAGIDAAGLLDATTVSDIERSFWEPVLSLWIDAVVVRADDDVPRALRAAADLRGAILIAPDDSGERPAGITACPPGAHRLLQHLAARFAKATDPVGVTDAIEGVHVVGDFPAPIVGRDARRAAARTALEGATSERRRYEGELALADEELEEAERELVRSDASARVPTIVARLADIDHEIDQARGRIPSLRSEVADLRAAWVRVDSERLHHTELVGMLEVEVQQRTEQLRTAVAAVGALEREIAALTVDYWTRGWGASVDEARALLREDERRQVTFRRNATEALNRAVWELRVRVPEDAPTPQLAAAIRSRDLRRDEEEATQAASFEELSAALIDHLDGWADSDRIVDAAIRGDREQREAERSTLEGAVQEASHSLERIQDATATLIEGSLATIGAQLDEIRRGAGFYGARLEIDAIRPDGPGAMWEWKVVPHWQRMHGGPYTRYDTRANTAQEKLFTVHLVLAALLAAPDPQGRVLILDELGDSLGDEHRRQVLDAIAATAERTGITVLGTCQDSVLADAAAHCGEILYFEHAADTEALNRPTRMFGWDKGDRIELTRDAVVESRPPI